MGGYETPAIPSVTQPTAAYQFLKLYSAGRVPLDVAGNYAEGSASMDRGVLALMSNVLPP